MFEPGGRNILLLVKNVTTLEHRLMGIDTDGNVTSSVEVGRLLDATFAPVRGCSIRGLLVAATVALLAGCIGVSHNGFSVNVGGPPPASPRRHRFASARARSRNLA
jgi:hypothetical protein